MRVLRRVFKMALWAWVTLTAVLAAAAWVCRVHDAKLNCGGSAACINAEWDPDVGLAALALLAFIGLGIVAALTGLLLWFATPKGKRSV